MAEPKRTELSVQAERALLVGVILPKSNVDPLDPLGELRSLVKTAGAKVVDEMVANRHEISGPLYVGSGKAEEIAQRCDQNEVTTVIFDNDLSPGQIRGLEEITGRKVLDRSELILDIFAAHAQTAESSLQVELAQLEYTYPRLHHMWSHLERLAGGASTAASSVGGIGTRGPGEKQLEIDRRLVQKRVSALKHEIEAIDRRKLARGQEPQGRLQRLPGRVHQRGQEHADEPPDRRGHVCGRPALCHAGHQDPPLAAG